MLTLVLYSLEFLGLWWSDNSFHFLINKWLDAPVHWVSYHMKYKPTLPSYFTSTPLLTPPITPLLTPLLTPPSCDSRATTQLHGVVYGPGTGWVLHQLDYGHSQSQHPHRVRVHLHTHIINTLIRALHTLSLSKMTWAFSSAWTKTIFFWLSVKVTSHAFIH